jgi:tetratricopeptide (TPR) repeat protein
VLLFEQDIAILERLDYVSTLPAPLGNLALQQVSVGALRAAEANLRRCVALSQDIKNTHSEAADRGSLGRLLAYRGADAESETELAEALRMLENDKNLQGQGLVWADRSLIRGLLLRREPSMDPRDSAIAPARRALELADEDARSDYPAERDYVQAHWLLGAAHRVAGQNNEAERYLHEALERCHRISDVMDEADILIDIARLRSATGKPEEARRLAEEALVITERSGYVLQGADAHLELAKLDLAAGDKAGARDHAKQAEKLAYCDGPPDYTYKAAYEEALGLLKELG